MDKEATLDVVETAIDVVEDQIETVKRIPRLRLNGTTRGQQIVILGVTAAIGAAAGSAVTYFVVKKRLQTKYEALLEEEVEEARKYYRVLHKKGDLSDPVELFKEYGEVIEQAGYKIESAVPDEEELKKVVEEAAVEVEEAAEDARDIVRNVFADSTPVGDFDFAARDETQPFIITYDEFMNNESDFEQANLTYYLKDGILSDETDTPIEDSDKLVGDDNLLRFGHGSKDNNVVFVRNPRTRMEYEIIRSTGSFAKEVHNFDDSDDAVLRHSDRRPRRFRNSDE